MRFVKRSTKTCLLTLIIVAGLSAQTREIPGDEARSHLKKSVRAVYTEMANIAHIQGDVKLRVAISMNGDVTDVQPLSGHPLFIEPAVTAVKQWHYAPFESDGRRIKVVTTAVIPFPKGLPLDPAEEAKLEELDQVYGAFQSCSFLVESGKFAKAEPFCTRAAAIFKSLDPPQPLLRMQALEYQGHVMAHQGKTEQALNNYEEELALAETAGDSHQTELAEADANVGNAMRESHQLKGAIEHYEKAEILFRGLAVPVTQAEKNLNAYYLFRLLRSHAEVLRQLGDASNAAALEREAAEISVESK